MALNFLPAIRINGEVVEFEDVQEIEHYLLKEQSNWSWLQKFGDPYAIQATQLGYALILDRLNDALMDFHSSLAAEAKPVLATLDQYLPSESKEGRIVQAIKDRCGPMVALLYLGYRVPHARSIVKANEAYSYLFNNSELALERAIALQFIVGQYDVTEVLGIARSVELDNIIKKATDSAENHAKEMKSKSEFLDDVVKVATLRVSNEAKITIRTLKRRSRAHKEYTKRVVRSSQESLSKAIDALGEAATTMESAKRAYHDQVDFEASVNYWSKRKTSHSVFKGLWFAGVLACIILMFTSMMAYYGVGASSGMSSFLVNLAAESKPTSNSVNVPSVSTEAKPGEPSAHHLVSTFKNNELAVVAADLVGAALIITLLSVLLKIALRQFNTHSFCALDAYERVTFTKTYLALLNEGKLKADEDRRMILESLFRSSQLGGLTETSFSTPVELILKALENKKIT